MILPGAMLGMLGGGQLGKMFTAEAQRMGYRVLVVDPDSNAPAAQIADAHLQLPWTDPAVPERLIAQCAAASTEFENVPAAVLRAIAKGIPVHPGADPVAMVQDRVTEKEFLKHLGIATADWAAVDQDTSLAEAWESIGAQAGILKTRRMGYDGKGQATVTSLAELTVAYDKFAVPCILERRVNLEREISVMVSRGESGEIKTWAVSENVHRNGILHTSVVPAAIPSPLHAQANAYAEKIVNGFWYVGVMGVECFVADGGQLLVNELAPRPHNSGHWTLDAAVTSQFEQQVRCMTGLPLGDTRAMAPVAMINLLGDLWPANGEPPWDRALALPGVRLHLYGKREARPGRKMGHLTVIADDAETALATAEEAWERLHA